MDLFSNRDGNPPLSVRVRPKNFEGFFGQDDIIGEGTPLRHRIENGDVPSIIFWGPPGSGKTTLTLIISNEINANFESLSATGSGVADIRDIIKKAAYLLKNKNKPTILFIDEIHRFNKAQQDVLLPHVEKGTVILIGATTENPSFEIISPLLSRTRVYRLNTLKPDDLRRIIRRALKVDEVLSEYDINIDEKTIEKLIGISGGDARVALDVLEFAVKTLDGKSGKITANLIDNIIKKQVIYDKSGEKHYNLISAFIKSIRGSDPDAALYWMCRMLDGGEDPLFIARRLVILASEDIGNADPGAIQVAVAAREGVDFVGMPEAGIILTQAVTYLASAPKSNSSIVALSRARKASKEYHAEPVPLHLRNAPTKLMKEEGYGEKYKYPHKYKGHFIRENYFPEKMNRMKFYEPSEQGYEKKIREYLRKLWKK